LSLEKMVMRALPSIRCECGAELFIINSLGEMGSRIETHAFEHKKRIEDPVKSEEIFSHIQDILIMQVFRIVSSL
jgi:hypothetical protein